MINQSIILAVFSLFGVVIGGALQYLFGQALESRKQLALQRSQSYADYLKALALAAHSGRSSGNLSLAADAKTRICIYGSPAVINALDVFIRSGENTGSVDGKAALLALVSKMRGDIGKDNQSLEPEAIRHLLFSPNV